LLYEDGLLAGTRAVTGFPPFTNSVPLTIGRASSGQGFAGAIDDVRIYARALSAAEIGNRYQTEFGATISISPAVKLQFPTIVGKKIPNSMQRRSGNVGTVGTFIYGNLKYNNPLC